MTLCDLDLCKKGQNTLASFRFPVPVRGRLDIERSYLGDSQMYGSRRSLSFLANLELHF